MKDVARLFETIRTACPGDLWSEGVRLSRAGAVRQEGGDGEEIVLRVRPPAGLVALRVSLHPEDGDWDCECSSAICAHVAAAVIALRHGAGRSERGEERKPLVYRFRRGPAGLALERGVDAEGGFLPVEASLEAMAAGRVPGPPLEATSEDLAIDRILVEHRAPLSGAGRDRLLAALARCERVRLDERPIRVSAIEAKTARIRIERRGEGVRLVLVENPEIDESFPEGLALCGDTLRPVREPALTARERAELVRGRTYPPAAVAELVNEVLPSLRRRCPVDETGVLLPGIVSERPRPLVELEREGGALLARAEIVYGSPPRSRVRDGKLLHEGGPVPRRDPKEETRLVRRLGLELGLVPGHPERLEGESAVAFAGKLERWDGEIRGEDARRWFRLLPPLAPRFRAAEDDFAIGFEVEEEGAHRTVRADPNAVLEAWREGRSLVPLAEGGWSPIPREWLEEHGHRLADLLAAKGPRGELPVAAALDLGRLCEELGEPAPAPFAKLRALLDGGEIGEPELPRDLTAELRPYQRRGVAWLRRLCEAGLGALLADDMGLGKTVQALAAISPPALVVAPTSVLSTWVGEARRFRPALRASVYRGPGRRIDPGADLVLTSYAILRLDVDLLARRGWRTVVLDESQAIKNPASQAARAAFALRADFRIALSGTPVENRLEEAWSQLHFLNPGLLGSLSDFQERYARPILAGDREALERLRSRLRPFLLRRLKRDVAPELPLRTDVFLRVELTESERAVYETIRAATRADVVRRLAAGASPLAVLEALLRLRQAACHPALVPGQDADSSSKIELLMTHLESAAADGHKSLVFSQWTSLLDRVEPHLSRSGIGFVRLDGATRDRAEVIERFQNDEAGAFPVFLISLQAGGFGLNLTAADHVFLLDPWWNPAVEDQAADRAHRIGQERPVFIYHLVSEGTIDERIVALQEAKRELSRSTIAPELGAPGGGPLSRDDVLALLDQ